MWVIVLRGRPTDPSAEPGCRLSCRDDGNFDLPLRSGQLGHRDQRRGRPVRSRNASRAAMTGPTAGRRRTIGGDGHDIVPRHLCIVEHRCDVLPHHCCLIPNVSRCRTVRRSRHDTRGVEPARRSFCDHRVVVVRSRSSNRGWIDRAVHAISVAQQPYARHDGRATGTRADLALAEHGATRGTIRPVSGWLNTSARQSPFCSSTRSSHRPWRGSA